MIEILVHMSDEVVWIGNVESTSFLNSCGGGKLSSQCASSQWRPSPVSPRQPYIYWDTTTRQRANLHKSDRMLSESREESGLCSSAQSIVLTCIYSLCQCEILTIYGGRANLDTHSERRNRSSCRFAQSTRPPPPCNSIDQTVEIESASSFVAVASKD